jgi:hypothetical protein
MRDPSPWFRLRLAAIEIGAGLAFLLLVSGPMRFAGDALDAIGPGPLGEPATYTFALGLAGAWNVAQALNPEPGTGRGPDLR